MFGLKSRIALIFCGIFFLTLSASAQTAGSAILTPPNTDEFPLISSYLEVYDAEGNFVHNLQSENIQITEDQRLISIQSITELETGAQFVVALNLGPTFAIRDINGIARIDTIRQTLTNWADNHTAHQDDLSFLTNDGPEFIHLPNSRQWAVGLESYTSDPRAAIPSLDVLVRAIEVAADPNAAVGVGKAVLLLTPPPDRAGTATLQSIISRAKEARVRVFVWMISSPAYFTSEGALQLAELAQQTGGRFLGYSGDENLPDIENYLEPLRFFYTLNYESQIRNADPHQISLRIKTDQLDIATEPINFELEVLPPNPIFLTPPINIVRANRASLGEAFNEETNYTPTEQLVDILIEFPDGRPRDLVRTTLYVDGEIAAENKVPPFDQFSWNLNSYLTSGAHTIKVEAEDLLGLSGVSIDNTVQITIQQTPQNVVSTIAKNAPVIAGSTVAVTGGILLLVLVLRGRIQPKRFGRGRRKKLPQSSQERQIPNTPTVQLQPLPGRGRFSNWMNRFSWPQRGNISDHGIAYMEPISPENGRTTIERIDITYGEIAFGKNQQLATQAFSDNSVDDLHARIRVNAQDGTMIFDENSTAGTWVNYQPISVEGVQLFHGDIIHFGRVGFIFKLNDSARIPKPVIIPQEPGYDS